MEQDFRKLFKNTTVIYVNSAADYVHRVGLSLKLNRADSVIEVYREEGRVVGERSSSRGRLQRISFRGEPTLEGLWRLLSLPHRGDRLTFFLISEVFLKETGYAPYAEGVSLTEFFIELGTGRVVRSDKLRGEEVELSRLKPVRDLGSLLETTPKLWEIVDSL
ncbi:hypothetical protein [Hydrogenivirga sp.]